MNIDVARTGVRLARWLLLIAAVPGRRTFGLAGHLLAQPVRWVVAVPRALRVTFVRWITPVGTILTGRILWARGRRRRGGRVPAVPRSDQHEERDDRRRRVLLLRSTRPRGPVIRPTSGPALTTSPLATVGVAGSGQPAGLLSRLVHAGRDTTSALVARTAQLPGMAPVAQAAQAYPVTFRAVTGFIVLVVAAVAVLLADHSRAPGDPSADGPSHTAAPPPSATTGPATDPPTDPTATSNGPPVAIPPTTTRPPAGPPQVMPPPAVPPPAVPPPAVPPVGPPATTSSSTRPVDTTPTPSPTPSPSTTPAQVQPWGYVYVYAWSTAPGVDTPLSSQWQWGTWRRSPDPRTAGRVSTVRREGTGRYRVRLPAIGTAGGVTHVTADWPNPEVITCQVTGYGPTGVDEDVWVGCFTAAGQAHDVPFNVIFAGSGPVAAPSATIRYPGGGADADPLTNPGTVNSAGGPTGVHRLQTGSYEATVAGANYDATGYLQITPYGDSPARCQHTAVIATTRGLRIRVECHAVGSAAQPLDTGWLLTYAQGAPLAADAGMPGAYVQTAGALPGLHVDVARSYNSTGGATTVQRLDTGYYRVGFKGVGTPGDTVQVGANGPTPGSCQERFRDPSAPPGEVWVDVYCVDTAGRFADLPFGVAVVRGPGAATGSLDPVDPGPHPAGPKWGYARMNAYGTPFGVETELNPQTQWSTWTSRLDPAAARWARRPTVIRGATGRYLVRLPGIGSPRGIPHVTESSPYT
jgi:hypothetical protein